MEYLDLGTDVVDPGDLAQIRRIQNGRTNGLRSLLVLLDSSSSRKSTRTDHNLSMPCLLRGNLWQGNVGTDLSTKGARDFR